MNKEKVVLTNAQIKTIVNSSYYHLKHYHELGNDDSIYWINQINKVQDQASEYLKDIITKQKNKEQEKLSAIFQGKCDEQKLIDMGMTPASASQFCKSFNKGKNGDIQKQVEALNEIIQTSLVSEAKSTENGLVKAAKVIEEIFYSGGASVSTESFNSLEEYGVFVSSLYSVAQSLFDQINKESDTVKKSLQAVLKRLNGALSYYKTEYQKKIEKRNIASQELTQLFTNMEQFISVSGGKKSWAKHKLDARSLDSVKAVLHRSASGFFRQQGGRNYENVASKELLDGITKIFNRTEILVTESGANVVGINPDALNKQQKADIVLHFNLSTSTSVSQQISISFSVKKHESLSNIQIHHGGSLFAYANRFQALGGAYAQDFSFLNKPNFQYVYVNELRAGGRSGDFITRSRIFISWGRNKQHWRCRFFIYLGENCGFFNNFRKNFTR